MPHSGKEEQMKRSNTDRREGTERNRSSRVALNPYFIEDIALTARELGQARRVDLWAVTPR
jgi:hypothetical protein